MKPFLISVASRFENGTLRCFRFNDAVEIAVALYQNRMRFDHDDDTFRVRVHQEGECVLQFGATGRGTIRLPGQADHTIFEVATSWPTRNAS